LRKAVLGGTSANIQLFFSKPSHKVMIMQTKTRISFKEESSPGKPVLFEADFFI
jgi:hypothetical protein